MYTTLKKRPIAIELFCGAGGMTLGLEKAGFNTIASVEVDPIHAAVHKYNFPYIETICAGVEKTTTLETVDNLLGFEKLDLLVASPPCQGFSFIGKRTPNDIRNNLLLEIPKYTARLNPNYVLIENVPGLASGSMKPYLKGLLNELSTQGYDCQTRVLNALDYGVSQHRKRLFIVCNKSDMLQPKYPLPLDINLRSTVEDAIADLPYIEECNLLFNQDYILNANHRNGYDYCAIENNIVKDYTDYGFERIFDSQILTNSRRTSHTEKVKARFDALKPGEIDPISHFKRLAWDGYCSTLRAGTPSSRGSHTAPRPVHPIYPRVITVREAARLHSYPDWFRFHHSNFHGFREVGNSVPPLLAQAIARQIIKSIGIVPELPQLPIQLGRLELLYLTPENARKLF